MQLMKFNIIFESFGLDPDPKLTEGWTRNKQFRIRNTDLRSDVVCDGEWEGGFWGVSVIVYV
jgi:hypothetical protein